MAPGTFIQYKNDTGQREVNETKLLRANGSVWEQINVPIKIKYHLSPIKFTFKLFSLIVGLVNDSAYTKQISYYILHILKGCPISNFDHSNYFQIT